jgi:hypothetical protein
MDKENSHGNQGTSIRGIISKMKETDMGKCILQTALYTKGIGKGVCKLAGQP